MTIEYFAHYSIYIILLKFDSVLRVSSQNISFCFDTGHGNQGL